VFDLKRNDNKLNYSKNAKLDEDLIYPYQFYGIDLALASPVEDSNPNQKLCKYQLPLD
jgi:hypothetical protein